MAQEDTLSTLLIVAGIGIGGYFLYDYLKKKKPEPGYPMEICR